MLTIKQIEKNYHEGVFECENVSYSPRTPERKASVDAFGHHLPAGVLIFGNGRIYVMNPSGATIAKYDLDEDNSEGYSPPAPQRSESDPPAEAAPKPQE